MTAEKQLFPHLSTHYLKALGELLICGISLQAVLDTGAGSEAWRARAAQLVDESVRLGEAAAVAGGRGGVRVEMSDGSTVVADADYLNRLVRKMHRHQSLGLLQAAGEPEKELIAS
jgi:hypothetical protein